MVQQEPNSGIEGDFERKRFRKELTGLGDSSERRMNSKHLFYVIVISFEEDKCGITK